MILYPGDAWPTARPEDVGASSARLRAINPGIMGDATVIIGGREIWTWGEPGKPQTNLASCARSFVTTAWGMAIQQGRIPGGLAVLDQPVRDLPSARAQTFGSGIKLKHLLSYTSQANPPGSSWSYSSGDHWPQQHEIFEQVTGVTVAAYLNQELFSRLGGNLRAWMVDDGTARIGGSVRDQARWAYLWLHQGRWEDRQLLDPAFVVRALGGGPDGDGRPEPMEGYQIHLFKGGGRWSDGPAPGVPDDAWMAAGAGDVAMILGVPSLNDLICVRHRSHGVSFGQVASAICRAVQG